MNRPAKVPLLFYADGYGFCLSDNKGKHPLCLDGDGARTEDKQLLLDTFNGLSEEVERLRGLLKVVERCLPLPITPDELRQIREATDE